MKKTLFLIGLLMSFLQLFGQGLRDVSSFDKGWLFKRYGLQADGGRIDEPETLPFKGDFDDSSWECVDLPHDWAIKGPFRQDLEGFTGKLPWKGIGWYRKHFSVSAKDKGNMFYLDFDGAMANAEVWLNGQKVGERPYGYSSFRVDLTHALRFDRENVLAVRLNTEKWGSRWYPGAGIYRHVYLVRTNPVHVGQWGITVTTPNINMKEGSVCVRTDFENHLNSEANITYTVSIYKKCSEKSIVTSTPKSLRLNAQLSTSDDINLQVSNPVLWDIDNPQLYTAKVSVFDTDNCLIDEMETDFGFRTIEFSHDNGFLLNGRKVKIQGVCMHHDLGALGAAVNESAIRRQFKILKEMGCNAIRTTHNPPAPEVPKIADEMGFLLMEEAFDCWEYGKTENDYSSLYKKWHKKDLEDLIRRDRNHPSIILWSTGNEVHEQYYPEKGTARYLSEIVHKIDSTRPVTFGASYPSKSAMNGTEFQVDVHGMNYAAGVYGGPDFYGEFLNKPGHEQLVGYSSESSSTMSSRGEYFPEGFHVSSYDLQEPGWGGLPDWEFAALDKYPAICGEFVWTGFDYLGEPTPFNSDATVLLNHAGTNDAELLEKEQQKLQEMEEKRPTSRSSYFGIVDLAGFPKDRYYLYQSRWRPDLPMVHILPHWNWKERIGKETPVFVYTSGDEVELFLNGKSLGKKKKGQYEYRLRWENVIYEPGALKAIAYKNGAFWAEEIVETTGEPKKIALSTDKRSICQDGSELMFVTVRVEDEKGRMVPDAKNFIRCKISGGGEIVATDNGDPTCHIAFSETDRPAFNGLLLVIVKANPLQKNPILLTVESEGLKSSTIRIATDNLHK